jgi:FKBP-type peptidyl-prolyl cis-trans isomerase
VTHLARATRAADGSRSRAAQVTFKAQDKTCDAHPTWKQCRKKKVNENSPKTALDNGLEIQELVAGKGLSPQKGDTCTVHYSLYYEGSEIMSSRESSGLAAAPIGFQFGVKEGYGSVVPAINLGIDGLKVCPTRARHRQPSLSRALRLHWRHAPCLRGMA